MRLIKKYNVPTKAKEEDKIKYIIAKLEKSKTFWKNRAIQLEKYIQLHYDDL